VSFPQERSTSLPDVSNLPREEQRRVLAIYLSILYYNTEAPNMVFLLKTADEFYSFIKNGQADR
jgi:hypothetical protein